MASEKRIETAASIDAAIGFALPDRHARGRLVRIGPALEDILSAHDDIEAGLVRGHIERSRFILTTRFFQNGLTDEGYDFNGWILEFYQDQCNGIVQIDNQGFYSPKGDLIVDLSIKVE